eukprot:c23762_g2_i1 orf=1-1764(-)
MGSCCSKMDSQPEVSSFHGDLQWQAPTLCQFCQVNGDVQYCMCDTCQGSTTPSISGCGAKGLLYRRSRREPMCSLCAADVYDAELRHQMPRASSQPSGLITEYDDDDYATHHDLMERHPLAKHDLTQSPYSTKHDLVEGNYSTVKRHSLMHCRYSAKYDRNMLSDSSTKKDLMKGNHAIDRDFLVMDTQHTLLEPEAEMLPSGTLSSSNKGGQDGTQNNVSPYETLSASMRLRHGVNIDNSDGIKLEVRYKHMLPHDAQKATINHVLPHEDHVLKRARSHDEKLLEGDPEANRSTRRRKSFQVNSSHFNWRCEEDGEGVSEKRNDKEDVSYKNFLHLNSNEFSQDDEDDDQFHDITVGVSANSLHVDHGYTRKDLAGDSKNCFKSMDTSPHSHGKIPIMDLLCVHDGLSYIPSYVGLSNTDESEFDQSVYVMSQENMQFISREEREWEVRAEAMGIKEDMISSRMQALSVVSTGDAILFSGANSDEFHLIPSLFVQHQKSSLSSPNRNLNPPRLLTSEAHDEQRHEKPALSVEDIILLLENDELNEEDLFSLLIDSCAKSSPSSSPSSSESSIMWSSPLSSSSSSSSS